MEEALAPGNAKEQQVEPTAGRPAAPATGRGGAAALNDWPPPTMPDRADEERLRGLRRELTEILDAHRSHPDGDPPGTLGLLDAALLAARTELLTGGGRIDQEIADFIYLMVLPMAGQPAAERARAEVSTRLAAAGGVL